VIDKKAASLRGRHVLAYERETCLNACPTNTLHNIAYPSVGFPEGMYPETLNAVVNPFM
jgi:hypothetical protein